MNENIDQGVSEGPSLVAIEGSGNPTEKRGPAVKAARFAELGDGAGFQNSDSMDLLMDVGLTVTVELGRTEMPVRDVLGIVPGSVIELKRLAADPVEVLVNNKVVARGEVVVVDDRFGVRVTEMAGS
jgi:flagellar motor switch protein FliN/FliY